MTRVLFVFKVREKNNQRDGERESSACEVIKQMQPTCSYC